MLELKQIFSPLPNPENQYVTYQNFLLPKRNFHNVQAEQIFTAHQVEIMQIVRKALSDYLSDDDLSKISKNPPPLRWGMNGVHPLDKLPKI